jgi:uncharacterized membrane protein
MYQATLFFHLAAAIIWVGGMTCLLFALRPAALAVMEAKPRALLMAGVWQRFFNIVLVCAVVLFATGTHLYTTGFRAMKAATGAGSVAPGWNLMLMLGLLMFLIFGHIYFAGLKKFKAALQSGDMPLAAQAAARIHTLVLANFVLGWVAIAAVRLLR